MTTLFAPWDGNSMLVYFHHLLLPPWKNLEKSRRGEGKYPSITAAYESKNIGGLFFAGALAHALDFGTSAGGFIHGFRYTSRALVRYLHVKNHGGTWPNAKLSGKSNAFEYALARINSASSLYQMYGVLADVMDARVDGVNTNDVFDGVRYFQDVPLRMIEEGYFGLFVNDTVPEETVSGVRLLVTITLEYGVGFWDGSFLITRGFIQAEDGGRGPKKMTLQTYSFIQSCVYIGVRNEVARTR